MFRIKDHLKDLHLTPKQWAKRALGRIASKHPESFEQELNGLNELQKVEVRKEFERMTRMLESRRGFLI